MRFRHTKILHVKFALFKLWHNYLRQVNNNFKYTDVFTYLPMKILGIKEPQSAQEYLLVKLFKPSADVHQHV